MLALLGLFGEYEYILQSLCVRPDVTHNKKIVGKWVEEPLATHAKDFLGWSWNYFNLSRKRKRGVDHGALDAVARKFRTVLPARLLEMVRFDDAACFLGDLIRLVPSLGVWFVIALHVTPNIAEKINNPVSYHHMVGVLMKVKHVFPWMVLFHNKYALGLRMDLNLLFEQFAYFQEQRMKRVGEKMACLLDLPQEKEPCATEIHWRLRQILDRCTKSAFYLLQEADKVRFLRRFQTLLRTSELYINMQTSYRRVKTKKINRQADEYDRGFRTIEVLLAKMSKSLFGKK